MLLPLFLLFINCKEEEGSVKIPIDLSEHVSEIFFSDFADSLSYLTLDMRDSCLISEVGQIYIDSNRFFVKDRKNNGIFIFDENNKYKTRINYYGRGPGEFIRLTTANINPTNNQIGIYDDFSRKILIYNYDGTFVREILVDDYIYDFAFTCDKGFIFIYPFYNPASQRAGLWLTDSNGIYVKDLYRINPKHKIRMFFDNYYTMLNNHSQGVIYYNRWSDQLMQVNQDSVSCLYEFNLIQKIPASLKKDPEYQSDEHFLLTCCFNMSQYLLSGYASINKFYWVLFDKRDNSIKVAPKLTNDINNMKVESFPCFIDEKKLAFELQQDENNYNVRLLILHTKQ